MMKVKESREAKLFNRSLERAISKGTLLVMTMIETVEDGKPVCRYAQESGLDESGYRRLIDYHIAGGRYKVAQVYASRAKFRLGVEIEVPAEAKNVLSIDQYKENKHRQEVVRRRSLIRQISKRATKKALPFAKHHT